MKLQLHELIFLENSDIIISLYYEIVAITDFTFQEVALQVQTDFHRFKQYFLLHFPLVCEVCSILSYSPISMHEHYMERHRNVQPSEECPTCNQRFYSIDLLESHQLNHSHHIICYPNPLVYAQIMSLMDPPTERQSSTRGCTGVDYDSDNDQDYDDFRDSILVIS